MNNKLAIAAVVAAAVLAAGIVVAQTSGVTTSGTTTTATDADHEAKFVAADKDKSGVLEGAELDGWKADLAKIDTDRNGSVSKPEFVAASKAGVVK